MAALLVHAVEQRCVKEERAAAQSAAHSWRKWAREATVAGGGLVHRWLKQDGGFEQDPEHEGAPKADAEGLEAILRQ
eukprot:1045520-Amphidinium_carterae.1